MMTDAAKAATEAIKMTSNNGLEVVMEFITPYKETAVEFMKNRIDDGMEIFPTLELIMDTLQTWIGFFIGFFGWLWNHPMLETMGEHLKTSKETLDDGLEVVMKFVTPYKETAVEFMKNRIDDGMEIFPTLELVMDTLKAWIAFFIGFFGWLWNHPMWETMGEHLKTSKEMLENGLDNAREISAPYIESGLKMGENYMAKTREMSGHLVEAGVEIGKKALDSAVKYSEVVKVAGENAYASAVEYSGPVIESGREAVEEALNKGTAFYEKKNINGAVSDLLMTISCILITIVLVGWFTVFILSRGNQYQPVVEDEEDDEEDESF